MKANINTSKGTKIVIEGTVEEVAKVIEMFKHEELQEQKLGDEG